MTSTFQQPLLDTGVQEGDDCGTSTNGPLWYIGILWYRVMFVFAPVPLDSFAEAVDIQSVAMRFVPRLPSYLSFSSKVSIYFILFATHLNVYTWFAQIAATMVVVSAWNNNQQPYLKMLALLLISGHCVLGARAVGRTIFGMKLKSGTLSPADVIAFDIGFWNPTMVSCALGTLSLLYHGAAFDELKASGYFSQQTIHFTWMGLYIAIYAWMIDVILRLAWILIAKRLNKDFKACMTYRVLSAIPNVKYVTECSICLSTTTTEACRMPCSHVFHRSCITQWARTSLNGHVLSCPMCRHVPDLWTSPSGTIHDICPPSSDNESVAEVEEFPPHSGRSLA